MSEPATNVVCVGTLHGRETALLTLVWSDECRGTGCNSSRRLGFRANAVVVIVVAAVVVVILKSLSILVSLSMRVSADATADATAAATATSAATVLVFLS